MKNNGPLLIIGAVVVGFGWMYMRKADKPDIQKKAEAIVAQMPPEVPTDWNGTWVNGEALIRIKGSRGIYAPDGEHPVSFAFRTNGNTAEFNARVNNRWWHITMQGMGEKAKVTGWQEPPQPTSVVIAP